MRTAQNPAFSIRISFLAPLLFAAAVSVGAQTVLHPFAENSPPAQPDPVLDWRTGAGKSYVIPDYEVPGFLATLSIVDRITIPHDVYDSTFSSTWTHVHEQHWVFDTDPFNINQFAHPYQGAMMYGFARSTGVSFWQALIYGNVGSFLWKMAGETDLPSINDQITTGTAGALLGESLFRMASLVLEEGGEHPGFWRELSAAVISPPTGFNRLVFGNRFKAVFPSYDPAVFSRLRLGASFDANVTGQGVPNPSLKQEVIADFSLAYGLPGKPGYEYKRPFDYFSFEFAGQTSAHAHNYIQDIMVRGMLYGKAYEAGANYRGIAGFYGSYDYISPNIFRVSSTAVSFGTTEQWWILPHVALQGTALGGVGFGAAGTIPAVGQRDYHYGVTPQGLLALRAIFGKRVMLDLTTREYYVSGTGSDNKEGAEQIFRADMGVTVRLFDRQAIGIEYLESNRHAQYGHAPAKNESEGTFSVVYTILGRSGFGAVDWRKSAGVKVE